MSKKATPQPLTASDKYYIENNRDATSQELAEFVGKPAELVAEYVASLPKKKKSALAGQIAFKKDGFGVAMMTEGTASRGDDSRKARSSKPKDLESIVFRPDGQ